MNYPEHKKLDETLKLSEFTQRLGEALDGGAAVDIHGCRYVIGVDDEKGGLIPSAHLNEILADLFGIDRTKLEEEKRAMLGECRNEQLPIVLGLRAALRLERINTARAELQQWNAQRELAETKVEHYRLELAEAREASRTGVDPS